MNEPLAKQLPNGTWVGIANVHDDGTIAPTIVGDCCCDGCPPLCLDVAISGIVSVGVCNGTMSNGDPFVITVSDPIGVNSTHTIPVQSYNPITGDFTYIGGPYPVELSLLIDLLPDLPTRYIAMFISVSGVCVDGEIQLRNVGVVVSRTFGGFISGTRGNTHVLFRDTLPGVDSLPIENYPTSNLFTPGCDLVDDGAGVDMFPYWGDGQVVVSAGASCPEYMGVAVRCRPPGDSEGRFGDMVIVDTSLAPPGAVSAIYNEIPHIIHQAPQSTDLPPVAVEWSFDGCDGVLEPVSRIGVRCDGSAEVAYYDPASRPVGSQTFFVGSDQYTPTPQDSENQPVAVVWSTNQCPEPIEDRYLAYKCTGTGVPIAYELSPGMAPGEGVVWDRWKPFPIDEPDCYWFARYDCTDEIADQSVPLAAFVQIVGECGDGPDGGQSGECIDPDFPIVSPSGPQSGGFGDLLASIIKTVSFGTIKPCKGCQQRQRKLNEIFPLGKRR